MGRGDEPAPVDALRDPGLEAGHRVMTEKRAGSIFMNRAIAQREGCVKRLDVVRNDCSLVRGECFQEICGHGLGSRAQVASTQGLFDARR
jgi:hypothetical protein